MEDASVQRDVSSDRMTASIVSGQAVSQCAQKIQRIERKIAEVTKVDQRGFLKPLSEGEHESVRELLRDRCYLLNALFAATLNGDRTFLPSQ